MRASGAQDLTGLEGVWCAAQRRQDRGTCFLGACPPSYTLVAFDGTWQEAKEIAKVLKAASVCSQLQKAGRHASWQDCGNNQFMHTERGIHHPFTKHRKCDLAMRQADAGLFHSQQGIST